MESWTWNPKLTTICWQSCVFTDDLCTDNTCYECDTQLKQRLPVVMVTFCRVRTLLGDSRSFASESGTITKMQSSTEGGSWKT